MFGIFKKKHTTKEVGAALAQFSNPSPEQIDICLDSLNIIDNSEDTIDQIRFERLGNKLFLEILILKIFSIDFACYSYYGNSEIKDNILDEMLLVIFKSLEEIFVKQKIDKRIFFDEMKNKLLEYNKIIKMKSDKLNIEGLGFQFSRYVIEDVDIMLSLAGTSVFVSTSVPIKDFLNGLRIKS